MQPLVSSAQPGDTKDEDYLVGSGILNESAVCSWSVRLLIIVNIFNIDIWGRVIKQSLCVRLPPCHHLSVATEIPQSLQLTSQNSSTSRLSDRSISSPPLQVFFIVLATSKEEAEMREISLVAKLCPF